MLALRRSRLFLAPLSKQIFTPTELCLGKEFPKVTPNPASLARYFSAQVPKPEVFEGQETLLSKNEEEAITQDTIKKVNDHIKSGSEGRLFAVVHICGKQFKVTAEDIVIIEGYWPPQNGDEIKLEKILMVGGLNFTLIGRPILPQDLVTVKATVIEKDLSHTKTIFYKRKRKQYKRINFYRSQFTMLRINEVSVSGTINERKSTSQYTRI